MEPCKIPQFICIAYIGFNIIPPIVLSPNLTWSGNYHVTSNHYLIWPSPAASIQIPTPIDNMRWDDCEEAP